MSKFDGMSSAELRAALAEYERQGSPAAPPAPVAPGMEGLSQKAQETASELYAEAILRKPTNTWTPAEREFIRAGINQTLRDMDR